MSGNFGIRTDLAVESKEKSEKDNVEIKGVAIHVEYEESLDLNTTVVRIQTEQGARAMEKPRGTYITMEAPNLIVPDGRALLVLSVMDLPTEGRKYPHSNPSIVLWGTVDENAAHFVFLIDDTDSRKSAYALYEANTDT